jgi:hypothetical protein
LPFGHARRAAPFSSGGNGRAGVRKYRHDVAIMHGLILTVACDTHGKGGRT